MVSTISTLGCSVSSGVFFAFFGGIRPRIGSNKHVKKKKKKKKKKKNPQYGFKLCQ